ncbi:MAG TPA: hypothetical protein EYQ82_07565 [Dehalococcoidia bacterium]|nr:hypothetical protein [Dehalococcoidia bacterium]
MAKSARGMANKVASKGRYGDTMLMHVSPAEVATLERMNPGSITRNPDTGQPEAWAWLLGLLGKAGAAAKAVGGAAKAAAGGVMDMVGGASGGLAESVTKAANIQPELASTMGADVSSNFVGGNVKAPSVMERMGNMGRDMLKSGGPQNYLSDKMGIPTDAQGLVGMAGEKLGVSPVITEGVQDLMDMPQSDIPGQQKRQMDELGRQQGFMNQLQPSTRSSAQRQIGRQSSVRNLVAQRFGEGSPITKYIGNYQEAGSYTAPDNGQQENITATIEPGETVHFMGDPNAPDPMSQLRGDIFQPLMGNRGNYSFPDQSKGVHASGTDIFRPNQRKTTGLEKVLGWAGFIGSQLQGKMPSERFREGQAWSLDRDYREELERIELQAHEEGRDVTLPERNVMNAMRDRIGVGRQETYKAGERRSVTSQVADLTGQDRRMLQPEIFGSFTGWTPDGPAYPATAGEGRDRSDDTWYRNKGTQKAVREWNSAANDGKGAKQFPVWNEETGELSWQDTPDESNWRAVSSGYGDAAVARLKSDDALLMIHARALLGIMDASNLREAGAFVKLGDNAKAKVAFLFRKVTDGLPTEYLSQKDRDEFDIIQKDVFDTISGWVEANYPRVNADTGQPYTTENVKGKKVPAR